MIHAVKITGLALIALLLLIVLFLAWVIWSESGTRFAVARAQGFLPEGIDLGAPSGRLADRLVFTDVQVVQEGLTLRIARLWLDWAPGELLGGHLEVGELGAEGVRYHAQPVQEPPPPSEPFSLPEQIELPISVAVRRLIIDDATATTAPDAEPLIVNVVTVDELTFADSRLRVESLEMDSPLLSASGTATATAAGDYPLMLALQWRLMPPDYAAVSGTTRLDGSLAALELEQRLDPPYETSLTGVVRNVLAEAQPLTLDLELATGDIVLARIQPGLPEAVVSTRASMSGPVEELGIRGEVAGTDPEGRRFVADLALLVSPDAVDVKTLAVRQPDREGELNGRGRIALTDAVSADLEIGWQSLSWPLTGEPTVRTPRGTLMLDGPLDDYRLSLDTRLEPAGAPAVDLQLSGTGSTSNVALDLTADVGEGRAQGRLLAAWDPSIEGEVALELSDLDPAVLAEDWPGNVDLSLMASAVTVGDQLQVTVSRLQAGGRLRAQPLSADVQGRFVQGDPWPTVDIDAFEASLGSTRISAAGQLAEQADLRWRLASDDLSSLLPEAAGSLSGSGTVTGPLPQVSVEAEVTAAGLAYADNQLTDLDLDADLDLSGESDSSIDLRIADATIAGTPVSLVSLEGTGRPSEHQITLSVDAETGRAGLALTGVLEDPWGEQPVWNYRFSDGELAWQDLPPWQLAASEGGTVSAQQLAVGEQCWQSADARACFAADQSADGLNGSLNLENLEFAYFQPLLPEGVSASGAIAGEARISQPEGGVLTADVAFETTDGRVVLPPAEGTRDGDDAEGSMVITFQPSRISADLDESQARARADLNLEYGTLSLQAATAATAVAGQGGTTSARPVSEQPLEGTVRLEIPDLSFVATLVPTLEEIQGSIAGDMTLGGTLGEPTLGGELELARGLVDVPQVGITLEDMTATLQGRGREVALQASAASGGGEVRVEGLLAMPGEVPTANLTIIGREFLVVDNDDARVFLSPDLEVDAGAERITITGVVHVPEAELTPGTQSPSAVTVSEDQVLLTEENEEAPVTERELYAQVRLTLGDEVSFAGFGLTARFEGDVLVNQEPETPTTATGELRILDGEYRAYGQGLVIESGRIYFAGGPVTQPALDVRAVRRPAEDILVGAQVGGTLQSPTFELFSEPSMTQQEQLSWLVLGRSMEDTPDGQESALSQAALALGLKGGDFLAKNIGGQVGLDQIGIETGSGEAGAPSDPSQASLVVGKYLSPKLYVSYGIGLFNPESVLEMQYEISRRWKLVTQSSGESTGADVLYTVELGGN